MDLVRLGTSGLSVSRIALGCMTYGDSNWRPWTLDESQARPFFKRAIEAGINFFDTADMYSNGVSEQVTGKMIREFAVRDEVVVATKAYYAMGPGPNTAGLSRKHILQACDASLSRLGLDTIDLYQIHRFDPHVPIAETLEALDDLVRAGKVRYIGASSGPAWRLAEALSISERRGWARFISMQNHYNLIYREEEREMVPLCLHAGLGMIPWSPLGRGLLTRPAPTQRTVTTGTTTRSAVDRYSNELYDDSVDWDVIDAVETVAKARGVPMARVALAWLLSRPGVAAPIVGATKLAHLDDALGALELKLSGDEVSRLETGYTPRPVREHEG